MHKSPSKDFEAFLKMPLKAITPSKSQLLQGRLQEQERVNIILINDIQEQESEKKKLSKHKTEVDMIKEVLEDEVVGLKAVLEEELEKESSLERELQQEKTKLSSMTKEKEKLEQLLEEEKQKGQRDREQFKRDMDAKNQILEEEAYKKDLLQKQVKEGEIFIVRLQGQLQTERQNNIDLKGDMQVIVQQKNVLEKSVKDLRAELEKALSSLEEKTDITVTLLRQVEASSAKIGELEQRLSKTEEESRRVIAEKDATLENEKKRSSLEAEEMRRTIQQMEQDLSQERQNRDNNEKQLEDIRRRLKDMTESTEEYRKKIAILGKELEDKTKAMKVAQEELAAIRAREAQLRSSGNGADPFLEELVPASELKSEIERRVQLEMQVDQTKELLTMEKTQLTTEKAARQASELKIQNLQAEISKLQIQISKLQTKPPTTDPKHTNGTTTEHVNESKFLSKGLSLIDKFAKQISQ